MDTVGGRPVAAGTVGRSWLLVGRLLALASQGLRPGYSIAKPQTLSGSCDARPPFWVALVMVIAGIRASENESTHWISETPRRPPKLKGAGLRLRSRRRRTSCLFANCSRKLLAHRSEFEHRSVFNTCFRPGHPGARAAPNPTRARAHASGSPRGARVARGLLSRPTYAYRISVCARIHTLVPCTVRTAKCTVDWPGPGNFREGWNER